MQNTTTTRTRQLAAIHSAAKDLGLGEPAYRNILYSLTGKRSAALMTDAERQQVVQFFSAEKTAAARARHADLTVSDAEAQDILDGVA